MEAGYNVSTMGGVRFYNVSVMGGVCFSLLCRSEITRCEYCDLRRGWVRGQRGSGCWRLANLRTEIWSNVRCSGRINRGCTLVHSIKRRFCITQVCWTRVYPVDFQTRVGSKER
jgi:hypothetical protein